MTRESLRTLFGDGSVKALNLNPRPSIDVKLGLKNVNLRLQEIPMGYSIEHT